MFYSDDPGRADDEEAADIVLSDMLEEWIEDGRDPAMILNAMQWLIEDMTSESVTMH